VAYCESHPDEILPPKEDGPLRLYHKHQAIRRVAKNLRMDVNIEQMLGFEDIAFFSYTVGGFLAVTQVPTSSRLALFAMELGITDQVEWLDSQANIQVFVHLPLSTRFSPTTISVLCSCTSVFCPFFIYLYLPMICAVQLACSF